MERDIFKFFLARQYFVEDLFWFYMRTKKKKKKKKKSSFNENIKKDVYFQFNWGRGVDFSRFS